MDRLLLFYLDYVPKYGYDLVLKYSQVGLIGKSKADNYISQTSVFSVS